MLAAAGAPADGAIVEIGTFKGRSTVGLAYVAQRYDWSTWSRFDPPHVALHDRSRPRRRSIVL